MTTDDEPLVDKTLDQTVQFSVGGTDAEITDQLPDGYGYKRVEDDFAAAHVGAPTPPEDADTTGEDVHTMIRESDDGSITIYERDADTDEWGYGPDFAGLRDPEIPPQGVPDLVPKIGPNGELDAVLPDEEGPEKPDVVVERTLRDVAAGQNPAGESADRITVEARDQQLELTETPRGWSENENDGSPDVAEYVREASLAHPERVEMFDRSGDGDEPVMRLEPDESGTLTVGRGSSRSESEKDNSRDPF